MSEMSERGKNEFGAACRSALVCCGLFLVCALAVLKVFPKAESESVIPDSEGVAENADPADSGTAVEVTFHPDRDSRGDVGLELYRGDSSRRAVEWFYEHITGDRAVSAAILEEADKNDIPLSLAFALAYTESRYRTDAVNRNSNSSVDRGLFQLNDRSFPKLSEEEFFDPAVSAKYGMSHLRFCMNVAGNEIAALAMYNAGTNKVRANNTPQMTLNYIGKITAYQESVEKLFAENVTAYFDTQRVVNEMAGAATVALLGNGTSARRRFGK